MRLLEITLPTPAENLALDEALLEEAESLSAPIETLRLWESPFPIVVVGRGSRIECEVNERKCVELGIPILRRTSGGAAIVAAGGSLMYAVVLHFDLRPELRAIDRAHEFVLKKLATSLRRIAPGVVRRGTSDLAIGDRKFSGNSLRIKRRALLYHGTLLYNMPLELIGQCLKMPPRAPDYRQGRSHADFVMNLPLDREALVGAVRDAWQAKEKSPGWPQELTRSLVAAKYSRREWNVQA